ncbi:hypothetical protein [Sphingopyxis sp.]|jgi:hypothetical protein|uniref:hypothetical protein n=1 Tax=Sphingopyxis sp. TaxID=1908224 RepID=UPI003F6F2E96
MYSLKGRLEDRRALVRVGIRPFLPANETSGLPEPAGFHFSEYSALIDTGALRTCVSERVIQDLRLTKTGRVEISNVKRTENHWTYLFYVGIWPDADEGISTVIGLGGEIEGIDLGFNKYFDVLLGMDVISKGFLHIENDGTFELGFPRRASY